MRLSAGAREGQPDGERAGAMGTVKGQGVRVGGYSRLWSPTPAVAIFMAMPADFMAL